MGKIHAIRSDEEQRNEPIHLSDHAIENLRFIRETMERSTHFTAVPGYGGMLMGVTALVAAYIAQSQVYLHGWLNTWLIEAGLAFAFGFTPSLICGSVITLGLWRYEHYEVMAPVWMLLYGASVVTGGAFSVRV